jgi:small-conductance mechanosensitive channel
MRLRALAKPFVSPRDAAYRYAWATLGMAILVVVLLAMELWVDTVIVAVFTVLFAVLLRSSVISRADRVVGEAPAERRPGKPVWYRSRVFALCGLALIAVLRFFVFNR